MRIYPTYELLGWLFGLEKSNVWENVQEALAGLESLADFPSERPAAERKKLGTKRAVLDAFPQVAVIVDAEEQPFRRPRPRGRQEPFYLGKKKRHAVKNQIACRPDGRIGAVSATAAGALDRFQVLKQVFRSVFGRHTRVIRVVAALVDRRIAAVPLKTYAVTWTERGSGGQRRTTHYSRTTLLFNRRLAPPRPRAGGEKQSRGGSGDAVEREAIARGLGRCR